MRRFLRLLSTLLLFTLVSSAGLPSRVHAAAAALTEAEAIKTLQGYGIVQGDETGDLQLDAVLTRAQAAAIFVRAMGATSLGSHLADQVPFSDARGHWGAAEIAMVDRLGLMKGDGNGRFRPNAPITNAEILTVMLRMVQQEPAGAWNPETILSRAFSLGIVPASVAAGAPATRRGAFLALANTITSVPVGGYPSLAAMNLDQKAPTLQVSPVTSPTSAEKVTISGRAEGALRVLVNGQPAQLGADQKFTYTAALEVGENRITVEAVDPAGNSATASLYVERRGAISRLTITGPNILVSSAATRLTVEARDRNGNLVPADDLEAELTGDVATFDVSTSTLITGDRTGKGTLTLRSGSARATFSFTVVAPSAKGERLSILPINKDIPIVVNQPQTVTVQVIDNSGKVVSDDYGRRIFLSASGDASLTITPVKPVTEKGVAAFSVTGNSLGLTTLTATADGLQEATRSLEVLTDLRVMLVPSKKSLAPDGSSTVTIKATLQDGNGRKANNTTGRDMRISLTASGTDARLTNPDLIIAQGKSDSGNMAATLTAGILPGLVAVSGHFTSDHTPAVQTLQFPINSTLGGSQLRLVVPADVAPGQEAVVTLQVVDGNGRLVKDGAYAFQLQVTSSNNEAPFRGLPQGVSLTFLDSFYYPVDDGAATTDPENDPYSVVGRTHQGEAVFSLTYPRSGRISIRAVPQPTTLEAYNPKSGLGPASSSLDLWNPVSEVTFRGAPYRLALTADSALGRDLTAGASGGSGSMTLRARVVDDNGIPVPDYNELLTLTRLSGGDKVTNVAGVPQRRAVNGIAEFTIQAFSDEGFDRYEVSAPGLPTATITLAVRRSLADTPTVVAIRGMSESGADPTAGYVGPGAEYMDVQLKPQGGDTRLGEYWVLAKVYRENQSTPIYTQVINLADPLPIIRVPRSSLKAGTARYRVVINNGYGDTAYSSTLDPVAQVLVADYGQSYQLKSAVFDAGGQRLILQTTGLSSSGSVDLSHLRLVKDAELLDLGAATVTSVSSSRVIIGLGDLAASLDPDRWHGAVHLEADAGWYVDKAGTGIADAVESAPVTPMAVLTSGALDLAGKRLYLTGVGLKQGSINWNLVQVQGAGGQAVALNPRYDTVTRLTDTEAIITLSKATFEAICAHSGPEMYLSAAAGWIQSGSGSYAGRGAALTGDQRPVLLRLLATNARYDAATNTLTLIGAGFKGMQLNPSQLLFEAHPGAAGREQPLNTSSVVATEDGIITLTLHPDDAAALEASFGGQNVYLNTLTGWLTDPRGWEAAPLPDYSLLFSVVVQ